MALEKIYTLDGIDTLILNSLEVNGRISIKSLAEKINMSAPSVKERLSRLENRGIIKYFTVEIDRSILGYTKEAIVRIKPQSGQLERVEKMIAAETRFVSCDRVTGEDCYVAKLVLKAMNELDDLLAPFHRYAETNTAIVKSALVRKREPFLTQKST